jgi:hypothetical protein
VARLFTSPTTSKPSSSAPARILGVTIDQAGCREIALRSRGTPRIANRLLRQVRDFSEVHRNGTVDGTVAREGLTFFGVDDIGLDKRHGARRVVPRMFKAARSGCPRWPSRSANHRDGRGRVRAVLIQQGLLMRTAGASPPAQPGRTSALCAVARRRRHRVARPVRLGAERPSKAQRRCCAEERGATGYTGPLTIAIWGSMG